MKKALVIDDIELNRIHIDVLLKPHSFECELVDNAAAGLQKISEESFDLVMVDWHMPDMDGVEFIKKTRRVPGGIDLLILLYSSVEDIQGIQTALNAGADGFLSKPVSREDLQSKLSTIGLI